MKAVILRTIRGAGVASVLLLALAVGGPSAIADQRDGADLPQVSPECIVFGASIVPRFPGSSAEMEDCDLLAYAKLMNTYMNRVEAHAVCHLIEVEDMWQRADLALERAYCALGLVDCPDDVPVSLLDGAKDKVQGVLNDISGIAGITGISGICPISQMPSVYNSFSGIPHPGAYCVYALEEMGEELGRMYSYMGDAEESLETLEALADEMLSSPQYASDCYAAMVHSYYAIVTSGLSGAENAYQNVMAHLDSGDCESIECN